MAVCVAVVDKDNSPLLVRCADSVSQDRREDVEQTVYSSLDVVEEKLARGAGELKELYLGLLLTTDEHKVYGYATNTKLKVILLTSLGAPAAAQLKDQDIRAIFKRLHNLLANAMANPFFVATRPLESRALSAMVAQVLASSNAPPPNAPHTPATVR